jgi:hypothetical protein
MLGCVERHDFEELLWRASVLYEADLLRTFFVVGFSPFTKHA